MEEKNDMSQFPQDAQEEIKWVADQMQQMPEEVRNSLAFAIRPKEHHHGVFRGRMTERAIHMTTGLKCLILPHDVAKMGSRNFAKLVCRALA